MSRPKLHPSPRLAALADHEVVHRVLAGETELFEILMRRYNQRLYRVARSFVTSSAEAEDILQEAYVNAYRNLGSFRGEARFSTWLTKIAVYEAMARSRRGLRCVPLQNEGAPDVPTGAPGPERDAENHELRELLRRAIESLPDAIRQVFVLREIEGLTSEETAETLDISVSNVRVRLHRAKKQLKQWLDDRMGSELRKLYSFDGWRCDRLVERVFARIGEG